MEDGISPRRPLRVALCGLGTVGAAVATRLLDPAWRIGVAARGIVPPELVAVGVRDPDRPRGIALPATVRRTASLADLAVDPGIDVVVELIGGTDDAATVVGRAIEAGKHVVTGNKALLASAGPTIESATRTAGVALRFEAAVAGGLPVLGPLVIDLCGNRIDAVRGIVNGTTNHILSAMAHDGRSYDDVLAEAQERGYAEPDPTEDVEGLDAANKLAILTRLAFGGWPDLASLRRALPATSGDAPAGIRGVQPVELARAADLGLTIKLVVRAERTADGSVRAGATPVAVKASSPLGSTDGVANIVEIAAEPLGRVFLRGPGAGGPPTASAVLGDVLAIARGDGSTWGPLPAAVPVRVADDLDGERAWFFVVEGLTGGHIPARVTEVALASSDEAFVTRPITLTAIRERLMTTGAVVSIYPVLAEA